MESSFILAILLVTITPGVDTALVLKNTLNNGKAGAFQTITGINLGLCFHGVLSFFSLYLISSVFQQSYHYIRILGGLYLLYLAYDSIKNRFQVIEEISPTGMSSLKEGLLTNMFNPKITLFYLTFLGNLKLAQSQAIQTIIVMVFLHALMGYLWFGSITYFTGTFRQRLLSKRSVYFIRILFGMIFALFGLLMLYQSIAYRA